MRFLGGWRAAGLLGATGPLRSVCQLTNKQHAPGSGEEVDKPPNLVLSDNNESLADPGSRTTRFRGDPNLQGQIFHLFFFKRRPGERRGREVRGGRPETMSS